jgi:hypothetical protein
MFHYLMVTLNKGKKLVMGNASPVNAKQFCHTLSSGLPRKVYKGGPGDM